MQAQREQEHSPLLILAAFPLPLPVPVVPPLPPASLPAMLSLTLHTPTHSLTNCLNFQLSTHDCCKRALYATCCTWALQKLLQAERLQDGSRAWQPPACVNS